MTEPTPMERANRIAYLFDEVTDPIRLIREVKTAIEEAVAAEREDCARICEAYIENPDTDFEVGLGATTFARLIRAKDGVTAPRTPSPKMAPGEL